MKLWMILAVSTAVGLVSFTVAWFLASEVEIVQKDDHG